MTIAGLLAGLPLLAAPFAAPAAATGAHSVSGATLTWKLNQETQGDAFAGGCNYFSAGQSDGSSGTYAAVDQDVAVLEGSSAATFATRCAFVGTGDQHVVISKGTGTVDPDTGAASIHWTGSWSVNFYGGLAPFWIQDPTLTVSAGGAGTLTATLGGYASSRSDPNTKTPVAAEKNVVVATLAKATGATGFTVTPAFAGVAYDAPDGATAQNRTVDGWGAWPKGFDDFQQKTGLSSYWYTSGGSTDNEKPALPLTVAYGSLGAAAAEPSAAVTTPAAAGGSATPAPAVKASDRARPAAPVTASAPHDTGTVTVSDPGASLPAPTAADGTPAAASTSGPAATAPGSSSTPAPAAAGTDGGVPVAVATTADPTPAASPAAAAAAAPKKKESVAVPAIIAAVCLALAGAGVALRRKMGA